MKNEVEFEAMESDANLGRALLSDLCEALGEEMRPTEKETVAMLSRRVYKGTECGAWLAVDADVGVMVGSIVEGVDIECATEVLTWGEYRDLDNPKTDLREWLFEAMERVEKQAADIWKATHGCPRCKRYWKKHGIPWNVERFEGYVPIYADCRACEGRGIVL